MNYKKIINIYFFFIIDISFISFMFSQQVLQRVLLSVMSFTRLPRKELRFLVLRGRRVKLITLNRPSRINI